MTIDTDTNPGQDDTQKVPNNQEVAEPEGEELTDQPGDQDETDGLTEEELEEYEHEGKKARIPTWLKPQLMMQADYTRKTQEVAEQRKAYEGQVKMLATREQDLQEDLQEYAGLHALSTAIDQYEKINFTQLQQQDPNKAAELYRELQEMRHAAGRLSNGLQQKQETRRAEAERQRATRSQERDVVLTRDIPNWTKETASKVKDYGIAQGLTPEEIDGVVDPRLLKILHSAWVGSQLQAKAKAAALKMKAQETEQPNATKTVTAKRSGPPAGLDDRLSADEWARRRNAQIRARA